MEIDFKKFVDKEFPNAYVPSGNSNERRIDCISRDCPKPKNHMFVNIENRKFICHRCGFAGDYKAFLCVYYGISFADVRKNYGALYGVEDDYYSVIRKSSDTIMTMHGIEEEEHKDSFVIDLPRCYSRVNSKNLPKFLIDRRIPAKIAKDFRFGVCKSGYYKGRLIIPVYTKKSRSYIAYSTFPKKVLARYKELHEKHPNSKKYEKNKKKILNPRSSLSNLLLFNYNNIPARCSKIVVVEGVFDTLRVCLHGYKSGAIFGIDLSDVQRNLLLEKEPREIVFMFDGDVWEDKDKSKIVNKAVDKVSKFFDGIVSVVKLRKDTDPDDIHDKRIFKKIMAGRERVSGTSFAGIYSKINHLRRT